MYVVLKSQIKIGKATFTGVHNVEIEKSIHNIAQTCVIKLPISAVLKSKDGVSTPVNVADYMKKGDAVNVTLWYDGYEKRTEFVGYVRFINRKQPLEIECENAVYLLRGKTFKKSFKSVTLKSLLQFITVGTGITLHQDIESENYKLEIKNFQINDQDGVWVLQKLKDDYMQTVYFTGDKELYVGLAYTNKTGTVKYDLSKNVINANDLKWQDKEDVKIKVRCVYFAKDGKKHVVEYGDKDGEVRTVHLYDVPDLSQLESRAKAEVEKYRYSGYKGEINAFLIPYCEPMMVASVTNSKYPERSGNYYISSLKVSYGTGGARRKAAIDVKLN
ncbi:MAG TPA: hypothetical protein PK431_01705 [Chitinophagales bacterium]|nr:hypothetical protein [Chitinophagales bacterium]